ncbi:hypothetical protein BDV93DRAFT_10200 [Ceratobasidium sp. AG-I]|nr:hypothetical protein BDV93DRAFT_10200 [Ceratobasidium sp. AG-I]
MFKPGAGGRLCIRRRIRRRVRRRRREGKDGLKRDWPTDSPDKGVFWQSKGPPDTARFEFASCRLSLCFRQLFVCVSSTTPTPATLSRRALAISYGSRGAYTGHDFAQASSARPLPCSHDPLLSLSLSTLRYKKLLAIKLHKPQRLHKLAVNYHTISLTCMHALSALALDFSSLVFRYRLPHLGPVGDRVIQIPGS